MSQKSLIDRAINPAVGIILACTLFLATVALGTFALNQTFELQARRQGLDAFTSIATDNMRCAYWRHTMSCVAAHPEIKP